MTHRKRTGGLVHYIAGCNNCDKSWQARNAQACAAKHTDQTGHETWVELGFSYRYEKVET